MVRVCHSLTPFQTSGFLLICLGVGNTGAAIAGHESIRQIDIVDLNHRVFETAPELVSVHGGLHRDPRVRFIHDDGRNFLNLTDQRYDLITSEPPPPLAAGVYRLYSREYYQKARERLTPNGFMTQWLPLFLMTPEAVERAVSSFIEVFPDAFLFSGYGTDFVLVGTPSPVGMGEIERRFAESSRVRAELFGFNITTPESLLARIVQSGASLRRNYGAAAPIRDQHNDLERLFPDPRARPVVAYEPADVLAYLERKAPHLYPRAEGILTHLGRLRFHVQGYPFETLAALDPERSPGIALAGADWMALSRLYLENLAALRARQPERSMRVLERFLEVEAELPEVQLQLAHMNLQRGRTEEAISLLRAFVALEPDAFLGRRLLADAYARDGRFERAVEVLQVAIDSLPEERKGERRRLERQLVRYHSLYPIASGGE